MNVVITGACGGMGYAATKLLKEKGYNIYAGDLYLNNKVEGVIVKQGKQRKITVFRYKPNKKSTRVKKGHRQPYTKVEIKKIK